MKNKFLILTTFICACLLPIAGQAQVNLVRNPSFEQYNNCPHYPHEVLYANYWTGIVDTGWSPDLPIDSFATGSAAYCFPTYFNECDDSVDDPSFFCTLPYNQYFYHYPRTGNALMGGRMYYDYSDTSFTFGWQQYIQGRLYSTLVSGQSYCVTFYASNVQVSGYAINHIGAYLDNGTVDSTTDCGKEQTEYTPQVVDTAIIYDTVNWTKIQGSFIANGTESFITLGNFFDTAHTEHVRMTTNYISFYLFDDVSVIASNTIAYAGPDVTITLGDTAWLGVDSNGAGMPCYWYITGNPNPIDSGGRIEVSPTDTTTPTTYVVAMNLCGTITYDTVVVTVLSTSAIKNIPAIAAVGIYPNPANDELNINSAAGCVVSIYNTVGQVVFEDHLTNNKQTENISDLLGGVYIIQITNSTGEKKNIQLLKE